MFGFTSMLINVLRDEEPTHVGVAFDRARETFRTQEYGEYKAGRASTPEDFRGQVALIKEVLDALRIRYVDVAGFEADDIIATLVAQARADGIADIRIGSGDRDTFQLVDDSTTIIYPVRGVSEVWRMDPNPDYDASDEIEYGINWFAWILRGVYPPPAYPPV